MSKGNILITGASTGIGFACAQKFITEGYTVFGSVRKAADATRLQSELGDTFTPLIFDVTDAAAIDKCKAELEQSIDGQGLQLLINNAGIAVPGPVEFLSIDDYRTQFEVNVFGLLAVTKAFLPLLGATVNATIPPGKIINISSIESRRTMPFMTAYSASKAAVDRISDGLRRELMMFGIDVITVNPGPILTPIWDKAEKPEGEILETPYAGMITNFYQLMLKEIKGAMPADKLGDIIFKKFLSSKPKTYDVIMNQLFFKHTLPSLLLSVRTIDGLVKKMLKIKSTK